MLHRHPLRRTGGAGTGIRTRHDPAQVEAVTVSFPLCGDAPPLVTRAQTGVDGRFSVEYVVAGALTDRSLGVATFDGTPVAPDILSLAAKVTRTHDEDSPRMSNGPKTRFSVLDIRLADGTTLSRRENRVTALRTHWQNSSTRPGARTPC